MGKRDLNVGMERMLEITPQPVQNTPEPVIPPPPAFEPPVVPITQPISPQTLNYGDNAEEEESHTVTFLIEDRVKAKVMGQVKKIKKRGGKLSGHFSSVARPAIRIMVDILEELDDVKVDSEEELYQIIKDRLRI